MNPDSSRRIPTIPEKGVKIPVLFDTDAGNEADDQLAIALALAMPERFEIKGFVSAHFHDKKDNTQASFEEINRVLAFCNMKGMYPVIRGGDPLTYSHVPAESDGVDFIIDTAKTFSAETPLRIVVLGACSNTVSAFLKAPEIADNVIVHFHGRTRYWPRMCYNFNIFGDVKAARVLFTSSLPFVLFDTGTFLVASIEEMEQGLLPLGPLGKYLHEVRLRTENYASTNRAYSDLADGRAFSDLGDVAFLADPSLCKWEETLAPALGWDLTYRWEQTYGTILRVHTIDRDKTFELLYFRLASAFGQLKEG